MTNAYSDPIKLIIFWNLFFKKVKYSSILWFVSRAFWCVYHEIGDLKAQSRRKFFSIHSFNLIYFHSYNTMSMIQKQTFKSFLHCFAFQTLNPFQHVLFDWQDVVFDATSMRQILMFNFHVKFLRSPKCLTYSHFLITKTSHFVVLTISRLTSSSSRPHTSVHISIQPSTTSWFFCSLYLECVRLIRSFQYRVYL